MPRGGKRKRDQPRPAKPPVEQPSFPLFSQLPIELQQQIFGEAIRTPNFHTVKVGRVNDDATGTWRFSFSPVTKSADRSGYRVTENISLISRVAYAAVRLAWRQRFSPVSLPFKQMRSRIDGANDLVVLEFPPTSKKASSFGYFHPQRQMLNAHGNTFDADSVAEQFRDVQKVAVKYSDRHPDCQSQSNNFRCLGNHHRGHRHWRMCPEELCGLMNCFPNLREFYIILEPSRKKKEQERVDAYIRNYCSLPSTHPACSSIAVFHGAGQSYIKVGPALAREYYTGNWGSGTAPYDLQHFRDIQEMLRKLKTEYLLPDVNPQLSWPVRDALARPLRMSLVERKAVTFKVLIAAPVEKQVAWSRWTDERTALGEHFKLVPGVAWSRGFKYKDDSDYEDEDQREDEDQDSD